MTRQKKEIIKRIEYLEEMIEVDYQLACGCVPPNAYDTMEEEIWNLRETLASLRRFSNQFEMEEYEQCCYVRAQCSCEAEYKEWLREEYGY